MATWGPPIIVLPQQSYGPGDFLYGPVNVPTGLTFIRAAIDRTAWNNPNASIAWTVELSLDGGSSWKLITGATSVGGPITSRDKTTGLEVPLTTSSIQFGLEDPTNPNRQIRGSVSVNKAVTTQVTIEFQ